MHVPWPEKDAPWVELGYDEERWEKPVTKKGWDTRKTGSYVDWVKLLKCPRCDHDMSVTVGPGALRDAALRSDDHVGEVVAGCNCAEAHRGRPDTKPRGCGYAAWIPQPKEA
jgi:hypothetical protein